MPKARNVSPEALEDLAKLTNEEFLAKHPDWTVNQARATRDRHRIRMDADAVRRMYQQRSERRTTGNGVEYEETIPNRFTWDAFDELFDAIRAVKAAEKKYDPRRHQIALTISQDKPVGIVFTGDWQLGSEGVDYDLWRGDMEILHSFHKENQGAVYAIGLGDYASHLGALNIGGSQYRDIVKSADQFVMLQQFFHLTAGMWLTLAQGCHDTFVSKKGAIDTVERYCELSGARHGWHGVPITVRLGGESYVIRTRHKYGFNSRLNPANSQRRQLEMEGPADIVAHGHLHTSFIEDSYAVGQDTVKLRSGSYQIHDEFARQQVGNVKADPRQPMVILYPDRHEVWVCRDFKRGLEYLLNQRR